jgi:hypothetical protein
MARYRFLTTCRPDAPIDRVFDAIDDAARRRRGMLGDRSSSRRRSRARIGGGADSARRPANAITIAMAINEKADDPSHPP